jgi:hypothetical protein
MPRCLRQISRWKLDVPPRAANTSVSHCRVVNAYNFADPVIGAALLTEGARPPHQLLGEDTVWSSRPLLRSRMNGGRLHMRPGPPASRQTHRSGRQAQLSGQASRRKRARADHANDVFGQLRVGVPRANTTAPFAESIGVVLGRGPPGEMCRVHAGWRVAAVADHKAWANWPVELFIVEPMSRFGFPINGEFSIAVMGNCSSPKPASSVQLRLIPSKLVFGSAWSAP